MLINKVYERIFKVWRVKRLQQFMDLFHPGKQDTILDVGGYPQTWTVMPQVVERIDCLNLKVYPWKQEKDFPDHHIRIIEGNACNMPYADNSYPIAFSNSVIEHVGDYAAQQAFAKEMLRVAPRIWVQTPAYECPIEPHYLAPFMHWYPRGLRRMLARWFTPWGLMARPGKAEVDDMVDSTRLLTKREMRELFPDCTILTERMLGVIPKSYVAFRL
ncbi:MAG: methyltransferase domain-containing protein [Flavobacteriales bacterium]